MRKARLVMASAMVSDRNTTCVRTVHRIRFAVVVVVGFIVVFSLCRFVLLLLLPTLASSTSGPPPSRLTSCILDSIFDVKLERKFPQKNDEKLWRSEGENETKVPTPPDVDHCITTIDKRSRRGQDNM